MSHGSWDFDTRSSGFQGFEVLNLNVLILSFLSYYLYKSLLFGSDIN